MCAKDVCVCVNMGGQDVRHHCCGAFVWVLALHLLGDSCVLFTAVYISVRMCDDVTVWRSEDSLWCGSWLFAWLETDYVVLGTSVFRGSPASTPLLL